MSELPSGWAKCFLEDCVEVLDSLRVPINNSERQQRIEGKTADQLYPYYGATGQVGVIDSYLFDEELIALGEDGVPFLDPMKPKAYMLYGKTWVNNHAHVLRGINGVTTNNFFFNYLNQFDYQGFVNGGTRLKLTQASMRAIPITLPPLAEQTRIAENLDELLAQVDTLKARIDAIPALLKRFRQSVLAAAVSGRLTEEWRVARMQSGETDTPDSASLHQGYETLTVEAISVSEKHSLGIGPFGSSLKVSDYKDEGYPLVFVREIRAESFGDSRTKFVNLEKFNELYAHRVQGGNLLITKMGDPPGDVAIYPANAEDAVITSDCIKLKVNESVALTKFIYFQMKSDHFKQAVNEMAAGVAQQKVSLTNFRNLKLFVPELKEQTEIVRRCEQLFAFAEQLEAKVASAKSRIDLLTQSILAKAFRGELVPQDPNDEPASVLLERIKTQRAAAPKTKRGKKVA